MAILLGWSVRKHPNGGWFAYGRSRTLGPFATEGQAWRAAREED
jgi:hypothetical protein